MDTNIENNVFEVEWEEEDQAFLEAQFLISHILDRNPSIFITRLTTNFYRTTE